MLDPISIVISIMALAVSSVTAWITLFRRGTVKMTQPTVIYFGPDKSLTPEEPPSPKVFLRTLLFSTSKQGRVIESMHITLSRNETHQTFNVWVYGDKDLVRGSGLFVGETGIVTNHHFLTPMDGSRFNFIEGRYQLKVFAHLLGDKEKTQFFSQTLDVSSETAAALKESGRGLYFDWGPDSSRYLPYVKNHPPSTPKDFLKLLEGLPL